MMIVTEMFGVEQGTECLLPLFVDPVQAGFPSPADDYVDCTIDLNEHLIKNPPSTFLVRVPVPSSSGRELIRWTSQAAARIFCEGFRYKKAGVLVTEIVSDSARQKNLFYEPNTIRDDKVSLMMDLINREHGRRAIQFAAEGLNTSWAARFDSRSPRYTTNWEELLEVG